MEMATHQRLLLLLCLRVIVARTSDGRKNETRQRAQLRGIGGKMVHVHAPRGRMSGKAAHWLFGSAILGCHAYYLFAYNSNLKCTDGQINLSPALHKIKTSIYVLTLKKNTPKRCIKGGEIIASMTLYCS